MRAPTGAFSVLRMECHTRHAAGSLPLGEGGAKRRMRVEIAQSAADAQCAPLRRSIGSAEDAQCAPLQRSIGSAEDAQCAPLQRSIGSAEDAQCAPLRRIFFLQTECRTRHRDYVYFNIYIIANVLQICNTLKSEISVKNWRRCGKRHRRPPAFPPVSKDPRPF